MRFVPRAVPATAKAAKLPQLTPITGKRGPNFKICGAYVKSGGAVFEAGISIVKCDGCSFVAAESGILDTPKINNPQWTLLAQKGRDAAPIPTEAWKAYLEDLAVKQAHKMHSELEEKQLMFAAKSTDSYFSQDLKFGVG